MKRIIFFGKTPPPIGGVTIKNQILIKNLEKEFELTHLSSSNLYDTSRLLYHFVKGRTIILSINSKKAVLLIKIMHTLKRSNLSNLLLFVTGGKIFYEEIKNKKKKVPFKRLKAIVVEAKSMKTNFQLLGFENCIHISNFREDNDKIPKSLSVVNKRFIFLSRVEQSKGIDICIDTFKTLDDEFQLDIYGPISKKYERTFFESIKESNNIFYKGILDHSSTKIYEILSQHDCLLFPSKWHNEGIPGVLIESKFAGISVICSDINYNTEIIQNNEHGIVISNIDSENMRKSIKYLYEGNNLTNFKNSNYKDRFNYSTDLLIKKIFKLIKHEY